MIMFQNDLPEPLGRFDLGILRDNVRFLCRARFSKEGRFLREDRFASVGQVCYCRAGLLVLGKFARQSRFDR